MRAPATTTLLLLGALLALPACREGEAVWHPADCRDASCAPARCTIGGRVFASDETNPDNVCESCQPQRAATAWSPVAARTDCGGGKRCYEGTCGVCPPAMAFVAGGTFVYLPDEPPRTPADVCIDLSEVTAGAYARCVAAGACEAPWSRADACNHGKAEREQHPANCLTIKQARDYCGWVGKRLPDDSEWMWTARNQARAATYPWGEDAPANQLCWSGITPRSETCPTGAFPAGDNVQGVHDLAGNVGEWVETGNGKSVFEGGHFRDTEPEAFVASFSAAGTSDGGFFDIVGFRCGLTP